MTSSQGSQEIAARNPTAPARHPPCPADVAKPLPVLPDSLAVAECAAAFVQRHTRLPLSPAARAQLEEAVVGLVAQLEEWAADPVGGPPDPWTFLRRRWHRQERLGWWGALPATTRRMLTGVEPFGRDSLIQLAWRDADDPPRAVAARWRTGLLDLDPTMDRAAAMRLARGRSSHHRVTAVCHDFGGR